MELVYVWIDKYGCIEKEGFNFSSQYKFKYDTKLNYLTLDKYNKNTLNIFDLKLLNDYEDDNNELGKVLNLTAIIGENGGGKSTLLQYIMNFLPYGSDLPESDYIVILKENDKLSFFKSDKLECSIDPEMNKEVRSQIKNGSEEAQINGSYNIKELNDTYFLNISNVFDKNYYLNSYYGNVFDLSMMGLLKRDHRDVKDMELNDREAIFNFFNEDVKRQVNFVYKYNQTTNFIDSLKLPDYLYLTVNDSQKWLRSALSRNEKDELAFKSLNFVNQSIQRLTNEREYITNIKDSLLETIIIATVCEGIQIHMQPKEKREKALRTLINKIGSISSLEELASFLVNTLLPYKNNEIISFIKYWNSNFKLKNRLGVGNKIQISIKDDYRLFNDFIKYYQRLNLIYPYFSFDWYLSSGEYNMLGLMSRLYSIVGEHGDIYFNSTRGKLEVKKLIICIDEADLYFHPRWQQQYLYMLLQLLSKIFIKCEYQIIMATHSPIMLSDIPLENIIFLDNGKNVEMSRYDTFGSNIYDLFDNMFFLNKCNDEVNSVTGKIANKWIEKVKRGLNNLDEIITVNDNEHNYDETQVLKKELNMYKQVVQNLGIDFLKERLLDKIYGLENKLEKKSEETNEYHIAIDAFNKFSKQDKNIFLNYIRRSLEEDKND